MIELIKQHPHLSLFAIYVIFSNAVSALPVPVATSSGIYQFTFKFCHGLASNLFFAFKNKMPDLVDPNSQAKAANNS